MDFPQIIGAVGVSLLLLAYLLQVLKWVEGKSLVYLILNSVGAGIACYSSWLISFMPFVILEGVWALVSMIALVRIMVSAKGA